MSHRRAFQKKACRRLTEIALEFHISLSSVCFCWVQWGMAAALDSQVKHLRSVAICHRCIQFQDTRFWGLFQMTSIIF